jgi:CHASE2 domain-containing sensor protein
MELKVEATVVTRSEGTAPPPQDAAAPNKRPHEFWEDVIFSAVLALVVILVNGTFVGQEFSHFTYRVLQRQLVPRDNPQVAVVDISQLAVDEHRATPRGPLKNLLEALVEYRPRAIGIDIDFSPEERNGQLHFIEPDDPRFFAFCESLRERREVPIYLGISRTQSLPPDQWLGFARFQNLAAALLLPYDPIKSPRSLAPTGTGEKQTTAPTMSAAVAGTVQSGRLEIFFEKFAKRQIAEGIELEESFIDYSLRERLAEEYIHVSAHDFEDSAALKAAIAPQRSLISNKILLLGDIRGGSDLFENPVGGDAIPGVLVHALAANTLSTAPLYGFPEHTRLWLDFALALLVSLGATELENYYEDRRRLITVLTIGLVTAIICFGMLVNHTRILWDDFLFVALALAVHPFCHRTFEKLRHDLHVWLRPRKRGVA